MDKMAIPTPTESVEQQNLFNWVEWRKEKYPELKLLFHIPNGGKRSKAEAARFKAEGVKAGVPDLCLPVARSSYHGLYIEMKRIKGGKVSEEQTQWIEALKGQGYCVAVCRGWESASAILTAYLENRT